MVLPRILLRVRHAENTLPLMGAVASRLPEPSLTWRLRLFDRKHCLSCTICAECRPEYASRFSLPYELLVEAGLECILGHGPYALRADGAKHRITYSLDADQRLAQTLRTQVRSAVDIITRHTPGVPAEPLADRLYRMMTSGAGADAEVVTINMRVNALHALLGRECFRAIAGLECWAGARLAVCVTSTSEAGDRVYAVVCFPDGTPAAVPGAASCGVAGGTPVEPRENDVEITYTGQCLYMPNVFFVDWDAATARLTGR